MSAYYRNILHEATFAKYGLNCGIMDYEESEKRVFMRFIADSTIHIAEMMKGGNQVLFYRHEKEIIIDDER